MSLAPARSLGAFLKARLAVKGIQCAARSLGTLTAAGRALLSSIGSSWLFRRDSCGQAISFAGRRKRASPAYISTLFNSIGWFEGAERDVQGGDRPFRIVGQSDFAIQLLAKRLDQPGSEALPARRADRRGALFGPGQKQPGIFPVEGPGKLEASRGHR